ncbi:hypothetical protein [Streptomyces sp. NPDC007905]|uniref:hypothetical protein n=1 Tax=Streptomyces sp. NPDC007905 TaxID=3364788 RepID=UPI0036EC7ABB
MAISAFGERKTAAQWADDDRCVVSKGVLERRIYDGWEPERAITTPFRGPAWQSARQSTLEEDRAKPAQRTFIPAEASVTPEKKRKKPRVNGALKRLAEPAPGWRDAAPSNVTQVDGQSSSIRTVRGGLPSLGKRR